MDRGASTEQNRRDVQRRSGGTTPNTTERVVKSSTAEFDQQDVIFKCDEINKRSVGKAIIKFCGHEGTENDANKASLRRLLQAAISHIDKEKPDTWKNAEVNIYDDNFDVYSIRTGNGHVLFLATFDGF